MTKNSRFQVLLNDEEEKEIREIVAAKHTSLSNFIRESIFEKIKREQILNN